VTTQPENAATSGPTAEQFADRLLTSMLGAYECLSVYAGDRLGWYRSLAADGPASPAELAVRTGTNERYAREWLEQQAVVGILTPEPTDPTGDGPRFSLPAGAAEVLTDETSLAYLAPLPRLLAAPAGQLPALLTAFRHGGGVGWNALGTDAREAQADLNRPWFGSPLADALSSVPDVHDRLARPGTRIADVGCGAGWSSIGLARAYPDATVEGFDVDAPSIDMARANADAGGLSDRVRFSVADGATLAADDTFDAAFAFECVHDMSNPVEVLAAVRQAVKSDGLVVIMDEAVAEEFTAPGDDLEQIMYGFSLFVCLPDGMSTEPSAATGTVMRPATLAAYGRQAGFDRLEVLPIEDFGFFRFYRLR
jgi:SAM-dependent methyltransferase